MMCINSLLKDYIDILEGESWKGVSYCENNYISNYGRVFSYHKKPCLRKFQTNGLGYTTLSLWNGKSYTKYYVHRLVADHFIDKPAQHNQVNHIDGDKTNNFYNNLEWVDGKMNIKHSHENKLNINRLTHGELNRVSDQIVEEMYIAVRKGESIGSVAKRNSVPRTTLSSIMNKRSRRKITDRLDNNIGEYL